MASYDLDTVITGTLLPYLKRTPEDPRPIILMTCGLAGAGKTTLAKAIQAHHPHFHRLSIDEIVYQNHGIYGIDYAASTSLYAQYLDEADSIYLSNFQTLLAQKQDVILERSFYAKEDRQKYRKLVEEGGRVVLVFLKARNKEALWERICKRSAGIKTANSAFDITRDIFEMYWNGFEDPIGEGEVVIQVT
ncbi:Nn.00g000830.m01.CDS01 [Neocucurbitaria sp. VM-36]